MSHRILRLPRRPVLAIASLGAVFGLSLAVEDFLLLFLRQDSGEALWPAAGRNLELVRVVGRTLGSSFLAVASSLGLCVVVARLRKLPIEDVLGRLPPVYGTLLVPVALTGAAVASLSLSPEFPFGSNLAVSLALEGTFDTILTALLFAACLVHRLPPCEEQRLTRRRWFGTAVVLASLALFTLATPVRFYRAGVGQGNMFKYLRMAASVAASGTLDISRAEEGARASFGEFARALPRMAGTYLSESRELATKILDGLGDGTIYRGERTASRVNRSMFRSEGGGVYYINAPGPGLMLVAPHLVDGTLNRWFDTDLQLVVVLFWQLLGALLVHQIVMAVNDIASRTAAVVTGFAMALAVPILFYTFQIYPELPGGLFLLFAFRKLVMDPEPSRRDALIGGVALAALPWLHQKYSVTAGVLGLYAAYTFARRTPGGKRRNWAKLLGLAAPLALSAYSIFLYNHALTGSLSPTATFESAGRSSFEPHNVVKGFLGLFLDRENGLFVFAPLYLLAVVGARAFRVEHRRLVTPFILVVASYLAVIASFPYWPGAVSTMGRYILSVLPLLALPAALVAHRAAKDGRLAGSVLVLVSASLAYSVSFTRDIVPSYQPKLLWSRALYADPGQYLPSFLTEGVLGSGPAHFAKMLVALLAVALTVYFLRDRAFSQAGAEEDGGGFSRAARLGAITMLAAIVLLGAALERWPGNASREPKPTYRQTLSLAWGGELWVEGKHGFEGRGVWVPGGGESRFLLHTHAPVRELALYLTNGPRENEVYLEEHGQAGASLVVPPDGPHEQKVLLRNPHRFDGPRRDSYLYEFSIRSRGGFVPDEEGRGDDARKLGVFVELR